MEDIGRSRVATRKLNKLIKKLVLRREKSIIKDLLPGKDDHIVFCSLSSIQLRMYQRILSSEMYRTLIEQQEKVRVYS
jgi:SNF2 family DNA or RNA helicase